MDREVAREFAAEFLNQDDGSPEDRAHRWVEIERVSASFASLMPDLPNRAVIKFEEAGDERNVLRALGLAEDDGVWLARIERHGEQAIPSTCVMHCPSDRWRVMAIGDAITRDAGANLHKRIWGLDLDGTRFLFATEHHVLEHPSPDSMERLGRALAATQGWDVGDLVIQDVPRPG